MANTPHVNRKLYFQIFLLLAVLTALEVGVVYIGLGKIALGTSLVGMAVAKAGLVLWFFMHLGHETSVMRASVLIPFSMPVLYTFVLIADAVVRLPS